ncbi:hypothetical protein BBP40_002982 [Aspergillus hancockii]|nr:hypothetical protein BBP40_002982 [Aspergillus hancockii]
MRTSARHTACTSCRQRKVRCDGGQPRCNRCAVRGDECVYPRQSSQDQQELLVMLKDLNERLLQTESALALQRDSCGPTTENDSDNSRTTAQSSVATRSASPPAVALHDETHLGDDLQSLLPLHGLTPGDETSWLNIDPSFSGIDVAWDAEDINLDDMSFLPLMTDLPPIPSPWIDDHVPEYVQRELYPLYFDHAHTGCFLIDQDIFNMRMQSSDMQPELVSLRYIVLAHGACFSQSYNDMKDEFYQKACSLVEQVDMAERFTSIAALQTWVLLALYELKQAHFVRACNRAHQATLMSQMLGLHKLDQLGLRGLKQNALVDAPQLEEQRRVFWSVFNLTCFTSIATGCNTGLPDDINEITTFLPTETPLSHYTVASGLTLRDAFDLAGSRDLCVTHGYIVTSALYRQGFMHVNRASLSQHTLPDIWDYDFWMHHYHIYERLSHLAATESKFIASTMSADSLCTNMILQATLIALYYAAGVRTPGTDSATLLPIPNNADSKCLTAAMKIKEIAKLITNMNVSRISPFIPWSIYVAAQIFVRHLHNDSSPSDSGKDSRLQYLDGLRSLLSALSLLGSTNPIAGVLATQIRMELNGGKAVSDTRSIGRLDYGLDL